MKSTIILSRVWDLHLTWIGHVIDFFAFVSERGSIFAFEKTVELVAFLSALADTAEGNFLFRVRVNASALLCSV